MPVLFFFFGRRAQRRPVGLIASTLIFSIFSFISFAYIMNTHIQGILSYQWISQSFYYLKFPIPYFIRHGSVSKCFFNTIQVFIFSKSQNIPSYAILWSNMGLFLIFQSHPNHNQNFSIKYLILTITQIYRQNKHEFYTLFTFRQWSPIMQDSIFHNLVKHLDKFAISSN